MLSKIALFPVASMAVFVSAAAGGVTPPAWSQPSGGVTPPAGGQPSGDIKNSCNSGPVQCCNSVYKAGSAESNFLHTAVGAVVGGVTGQAGVQCSPITGIGLGNGAQCSSQPVCCTGNHMNGLVVVGCSPVNANL